LRQLQYFFHNEPGARIGEQELSSRHVIASMGASNRKNKGGHQEMSEQIIVINVHHVFSMEWLAVIMFRV